jgi:hypothetical protein
MSNSDARLLRLLLGQPARDAHFERGRRLPAHVFWIYAEFNGEGFYACDEDVVGETLVFVLVRA